jgi:Protein of unknown function (DUF1861).
MALFEKITRSESGKQQLDDYKRFHYPKSRGELISFEGVDGYDVYNTSVPFTDGDRTVIAGRVESRDSERSRTMFFESTQTSCKLIADAPVFDLQDPFVTFIDGELLLGGVYVDWDRSPIFYETRFYRGKNIYSLKFAFSGPGYMKDIRLLQLADGRIAVCSRPNDELIRNKFQCVCKVGFAIADKLSDITPEFIYSAPIIDNLFPDDEWGGCNQLHDLGNGRIGVIGHRSWGEVIDGVHHIHYYSMAFGIDYLHGTHTAPKIIAERSCYPAAPAKLDRIADVTFTSGLVRLSDGKAMIYSGLSDAREGRMLIEDPLTEYIKL